MGTEKTPVLGHKLNGLQNGEFTLSIRVIILIICYYTSILTTTVCGREDIINFTLETKIPKLIGVKDLAQGQIARK